MTVGEVLAAELLSALKEEFAAVGKRLDQLSSGQAALTRAVDKIGQKLETSTGRPSISLSATESFDTQPFSVREDSDSLPIEPKPSLQRLSRKSLQGVRSRGAEASEWRKTNELNRQAMQEMSRLFGIDRRRAERVEGRSTWQRLTEFMKNLRERDTTALGIILDQVVSAVVVLNAIFLGVSSDYWNGDINIFCLIEVLFCIVFLSELITKIRVLGFREFLCGKDRLSNTVDMLLVCVDTLQLILFLFVRSVSDWMQRVGVPSASLFRIVRVVRITRILRLLRQPIFHELLAMVEAIISGAGTLSMAVVLYLLVIYVIALLCKDVFGHDAEYAEVFVYFNSVPRSMFTVFRCSFGDCSSNEGRPIPEYVNKDYGALSGTIYCVFLFVVAIGLFNVISAIFVDRTLARAEKLDAEKAKKRLADEDLWATQMSTVVRRCLVKLGIELDDVKDLSLLESIPSDALEDLCRNDKEVTAALTALGIDSCDHTDLAKILDQDMSGCISLHELIVGLNQMRGLPRRSDIVSTGLMLQSVQSKLDDLHRTITSQKQTSQYVVGQEVMSPGLRDTDAFFVVKGSNTFPDKVQL